MVDKNSTDVFMGTVDGRQPSILWNIQIKVNSKPLDFCIDTAAEVSVISQQVHKIHVVGSPPLEKPDLILRGPEIEVCKEAI